jgi:ribosomal protein S18 acetylase RimI-like enzyme
MIKFIQFEDVAPIRNTVLRDGKMPTGQPRFPSDDLSGIFHLGYYVGDELACVASFHPESYGEFNGTGYQLRGMATLEAYRGKGHGNQLLNFAIVYLRGQKANYVWCNARKIALRFYESIGFEIISDEFEVPGIGPHRVLYLKIQ